MIKPLKLLAAFAAASTFVVSAHAEKLAVTIKQPERGAILFTTLPIEISGTAKPAAKISAVTVRVAGQTLRPIGTNRWAVSVSISKPGRYTIKVTAKTDNRHHVTRRRSIKVVQPIR